MKAVVIGATGFLGRALCRVLTAEGHTTFGTWYPAPEGLPPGLAGAAPSDRLDLAPADADRVFVCAAHIPYGAMDRPDPRLVAANVDLPIRVCARFRRARVVFASSVAVHGSAPSPRNEASPFVGPDEYGLTKLAGEAVVRQHASYAVVRFTSLHGEGMADGTFLPRIARQAREERRIRLFGDGSRLQDYLFVDDAARVMALAGMAESNRVFLGASGVATSNLDAARVVAAIVPGTQIVHEGADAAPSCVYDPRESHRRLGFAPSVNFAAGLARWVPHG